VASLEEGIRGKQTDVLICTRVRFVNGAGDSETCALLLSLVAPELSMSRFSLLFVHLQRHLLYNFIIVIQKKNFVVVELLSLAVVALKDLV